MRRSGAHPSTRLNEPLWSSQGASAGVLKPLAPQAGASLGAPFPRASNTFQAFARLLTCLHMVIFHPSRFAVTGMVVAKTYPYGPDRGGKTALLKTQLSTKDAVRPKSSQSLESKQTGRRAGSQQSSQGHQPLGDGWISPHGKSPWIRGHQASATANAVGSFSTGCQPLGTAAGTRTSPMRLKLRSRQSSW